MHLVKTNVKVVVTVEIEHEEKNKDLARIAVGTIGKMGTRGVCVKNGVYAANIKDICVEEESDPEL